MELNNRLLTEPGEMIGSGLHDRHTAGTQRLGFAGIEFVSRAHVHYAGKYRHMLEGGVRVRWDFGVRRELQPSNKGLRLIEGAPVSQRSGRRVVRQEGPI